MSGNEAIAEIEALEAERCSALVAGDVERLGLLVADDLVHIHTNGKQETRAEYLEGVAERLTFRKIDRSDTLTRVHGDAAIMTGLLRQVIHVRETGAEVDLVVRATIVWLKRDGRWQIASFQAARLPE